MVVEDVLAVLIGVGEAHGQHRRDVNSASLLLEMLDDLGSDRSLPKRVLEDRVVGGLGGLERDDRVPLFRDDVRTLLEVGTVEEVRRVVGDAVVEVDALKGRDGVIIGRGGLGLLREKRDLAGRGRGWRRRSTGMVLHLGVEAPKLEDGEP